MWLSYTMQELGEGGGGGERLVGSGCMFTQNRETEQLIKKVCLPKQLNRRGKFIKKLWCCVSGKFNKIIRFYHLG